MNFHLTKIAADIDRKERSFLLNAGVKKRCYLELRTLHKMKFLSFLNSVITSGL